MSKGSKQHNASAMNTVNSKFQKPMHPHSHSSDETASCKKQMLQVSLCTPKIQKTNGSTLTGADHEASYSSFNQIGLSRQDVTYLSFDTFPIKTTHDCNRKKIWL